MYVRYVYRCMRSLREREKKASKKVRLTQQEKGEKTRKVYL